MKLCYSCNQPIYKYGLCKAHYLVRKKKQKLYEKNNRMKEYEKQKIQACSIIYTTGKILKDDPESLVNDHEFVKKYLGFTCKRLEEEE